MVDSPSRASTTGFNSIQIDGTNNNDLFGSAFSGNGTPGWAVGLTAFTPEAVKELQVVTAPFDVRYGNFAGGLINAVTRSGSNRVEGSILGYFEGDGLSGTDSTGGRGEDFNRKEFGLTLGAPIVRDRVAFFLNAALRRQVFPQSVPAPTSDTTGGADSAGVGIRYESLVRFQDLLRVHGVEPGSFSAGAVSAHRPETSSPKSRRSSGSTAASRYPTTTATATTGRKPATANPASMPSPRAAARIRRPSMPPGSPGPRAFASSLF